MHVLLFYTLFNQNYYGSFFKFFLYFQFSDNQISIINSLTIFSVVQSTSGVSEVCHGTAPTRSEVDPSRAHIQGVCSKGRRRKFNRSSKTVGSPLNGADVVKRSSTGKPAGPV